MPTDPQASLALAAAVQRLANWTDATTPPSPADVVTIARRLEIAATAQVERAARRVPEEGQGWPAVASLLGLDALPCHVADLARLAFDYCAAWPGRPSLMAPVLWDCPACAQTIADHGPADNPACSQQGHADGCKRLAADIAERERRTPR